MERIVYHPIMDFYGKKVDGLARLRYEDDEFVDARAYRNGNWVHDAELSRDLHEGYLGEPISPEEAERIRKQLDETNSAYGEQRGHGEQPERGGRKSSSLP